MQEKTITPDWTTIEQKANYKCEQAEGLKFKIKR